MLEIRPATDKDVVALTTLHNACLPHMPLTQYTCKFWISEERYHVIVGCIDNRIAGILIAISSGKDTDIIRICTDEAFRRQGIAKSMMDWLANKCKDNRELDMWLDVDETNVPAIKLYESLGFETVKIRKDYYRMDEGETRDALTMKKNYSM